MPIEVSDSSLNSSCPKDNQRGGLDALASAFLAVTDGLNYVNDHFFEDHFSSKHPPQFRNLSKEDLACLSMSTGDSQATVDLLTIQKEIEAPNDSKSANPMPQSTARPTVAGGRVEWDTENENEKPAVLLVATHPVGLFLDRDDGAKNEHKSLEVAPDTKKETSAFQQVASLLGQTTDPSTAAVTDEDADTLDRFVLNTDLDASIWNQLYSATALIKKTELTDDAASNDSESANPIPQSTAHPTVAEGRVKWDTKNENENPAVLLVATHPVGLFLDRDDGAKNEHKSLEVAPDTKKETSAFQQVASLLGQTTDPSTAAATDEDADTLDRFVLNTDLDASIWNQLYSANTLIKKTELTDDAASNDSESANPIPQSTAHPTVAEGRVKWDTENENEKPAVLLVATHPVGLFLDRDDGAKNEHKSLEVAPDTKKETSAFQQVASLLGQTADPSTAAAAATDEDADTSDRLFLNADLDASIWNQLYSAAALIKTPELIDYSKGWTKAVEKIITKTEPEIAQDEKDHANSIGSLAIEQVTIASQYESFDAQTASIRSNRMKLQKEVIGFFRDIFNVAGKSYDGTASKSQEEGMPEKTNARRARSPNRGSPSKKRAMSQKRRSKSRTDRRSKSRTSHRSRSPKKNMSSNGQNSRSNSLEQTRADNEADKQNCESSIETVTSSHQPPRYHWILQPFIYTGGRETSPIVAKGDPSSPKSLKKKSTSVGAQRREGAAEVALTEERATKFNSKKSSKIKEPKTKQVEAVRDPPAKDKRKTSPDHVTQLVEMFSKIAVAPPPGEQNLMARPRARRKSNNVGVPLDVLREKRSANTLRRRRRTASHQIPTRSHVAE